MAKTPPSHGGNRGSTPLRTMTIQSNPGNVPANAGTFLLYGEELMKNEKEICDMTETLLSPIAEKLGYELVDVEFVKESGEYFLRAFIDKDGGITLDDCVSVSDAFNPVLDKEDYIDYSYTFEVSSPGLTRPLKKEKDYIRNIGKLIEIHTYSAVSGCKFFRGILKSYDKDTVTIDCDGSIYTLERSNISGIRQAFTD